MLAACNRNGTELVLSGTVQLHMSACHSGKMHDLWIPAERDFKAGLHAHRGVCLPNIALMLRAPCDGLHAQDRMRQSGSDGELCDQWRTHHGRSTVQRFGGKKFSINSKVAREIVETGIPDRWRDEPVDIDG